ncbi:MAG: Rpn family recombination-promoting nuclease/putative transposase [Selenomonadaceae bacterium]|nr:Rpn family recombination-promoting nuclease/putative transposase [Selenomonadaceae bacterium]
MNQKLLDAKWESLTIRDNFIFSKTMESEPDLCRYLLELILRVKISKLSWIEREKTLEERTDSRGIRLDVYVEEKDRNRVFNVEMQIANTHNLAKRIRYYQSMIDLDSLKRGQNFDKLGESYIIFICLFDVFGKGRHMYTFRETCEEDSTLKLGDGTAKIFLNTKGIFDDAGGDFKAFLDFVECGTISGEFVKKLAAAVNRVKLSLETRLEYMTFELAMEQRAFEKQIELIKNLLAVGTPIKFILQATGLTEEEISKILADDTPNDSKNLESEP